MTYKIKIKIKNQCFDTYPKSYANVSNHLNVSNEMFRNSLNSFRCKPLDNKYILISDVNEY